MAPPTDCPAAELLRRSLDLDDPMTEQERQQISEHVDRCQQGCKQAIEALLRGNTLMLAQGATQAGKGSMVTKTAAPDDAEPLVPGYELLGELGRGGMGVVYRARQLTLDRVVALKMLLRPLNEAEAEEYARFTREALAIASLNHRGIVQIHDLGRHSDQPFIAMELVEGGNLASQLAGMPQPPRQAAVLVAQLAEAIEAAHQQQIIHRDLKPANILMTADGTPKITDFGLAKRLDVESTESVGKFLGTASYAAPEQALGRLPEVGPATDVYGLGAILYEMLTGRPPFRAASTWETLQQVVGSEPVPPSRLAEVPRDLETICLKCLAKEPARRYPSALALAEDLHLFQAGQPIRARPVGWRERLVKWSKRRPAVAALTATVVVVILVGLVTSLGLAGWAFRERDRARDRLEEAQQANRRRVQLQVEQLGIAEPEAVPGLLAALKDDREAVRPRLQELWGEENGERKQRMRAGLALLADDPGLRKPLADWMIETDEPRELLLVRKVLAPHGTALAEGLWNKVDDPNVKDDIRFRALVALASLDPDGARWSQAGPTAAELLLKSNPQFLGLWIEALWSVRNRLMPQLTEVFRGRIKSLADRRLQAAVVLANYAAEEPATLADLACEADAEQFATLRRTLEKKSKEAHTALTAVLTTPAPARETEAGRLVRARRQANAAAVLAALGEPDAIWPLLKHARTPDARTILIHGLAGRGVEPRLLIRRLEEEQDASIRAALILALGEFAAEKLPPAERATLMAKLLTWYRNDPDPGVHGAIDWLLRHGKEGRRDRPLDWGGRNDLDKIVTDLAGKSGPAGQRWYVNGQSQTLSAVRGPVEFSMGSPRDEVDREEHELLHRRKIGRSFAVAAAPVTVEQWDKFLKAMKDAKLEVKHFHWKHYAPDPNCPIVAVSWYDAAMYCRWLSELEHVPPEQMVYPPLQDILSCADGKTPLRLPKDHLARTGYRLPTDAEFEFASRADTMTRWYFGGTEEFLSRHAWFFANSENRTWPVGQKKPNELGLFDLHGNAWTWCLDGPRPYIPAGMEDSEDNRDVDDTGTRILRGGSFLYRSAILRSAFHEDDRPSYPDITVGLRLARTLPRDHFTVLGSPDR